MRNLFFVFVLLSLSLNLYADVKCEIRGHLYDKNNNKPLKSGFIFRTHDHVISEYIPTDKDGAFVIYVKEYGTYYLAYQVGQCKTEELEVVINDSTPYNLNVDFYVSTWDSDCIVDKLEHRPKIAPRLSTTRGWRGMIDFDLALRMKPKRRFSDVSHSIAIGAEWNYGFKRYMFGPKIGYTYLNECFPLTGLTFSLNGVYFFDRSCSGFYLQPQLGYEVVEILEFIVQYNFVLVDNGIGYRINGLSGGIRFWMFNP